MGDTSAAAGMDAPKQSGPLGLRSALAAKVTPPTSSIDHVIGVLPYGLGLPVNARNAAVYLSSRSGC